MTQKTNPEAVILGALFDFAGHLRTADIMNPHAGIDGFAKLRKLSATEVPTMTWRDQLDTLRDNAERLPSDSELVTDLLLLAEAFKDGDPDADNKVFDVLNNAATRLRQVDRESGNDKARS
jgi:fido (protein-threonine AMPylation protein)